MCAAPNPKFSKEKILAMPFAHKLWIVASLKHRTFIQWGPNGDSILLNLSDLNVFLRSRQSMFHAKDLNEFLINLRDHGFELVQQDVGNLIEYRHRFFNRDNLEDVCRIKNEAPASQPDKKTEERKKFDAESRMPRDRCVKKHGSMTQLQFLQAKQQITMKYNALQDALKKFNTNGTPIPKDLLIQPAESKLVVNKDENYIGYHGEAKPNELESFYGDHKPSLAPSKPKE